MKTVFIAPAVIDISVSINGQLFSPRHKKDQSNLFLSKKANEPDSLVLKTVVS